MPPKSPSPTLSVAAPPKSITTATVATAQKSIEAATVAAAPKSITTASKPIAAAPQPIAAAKPEAVVPVESKSAESKHEEVKEKSISPEAKASPEPEVLEDAEGNVDHVQDEETVDSSSKSGSQVKLRYDYKDGKHGFFLQFDTLNLSI